MFEELRTLRLEEDAMVLIDQNWLPSRLVFKRCKSVDEVAQAIKDMSVRGAPAIGVAAAMGLALTAIKSKAIDRKSLINELLEAASKLKTTRPTAYNLFWALNRILKVATRVSGGVDEVKQAVVSEALRMADEDVEANRRIGLNGLTLLKDGDVVLTHCNAGALATVGYGTALAPIRAAFSRGMKISVIATETRPKLQGARLTAFELKADGIPVKLITDSMVGYVMMKGLVSKVIVGADRVLRDGHVVNKIGTLTIAIVAKHFNIPFYVAAPTSTFDLTSRVDDVIIEERPMDEVVKINGIRIAPAEVEALNPAFDVTPPSLISGIVTERMVIKPPLEEGIIKAFKDH
ncbi:MAG: S-methyl-5-thioribose-1-phosphate isomerase [Candidatus Nezhaarchaeales archaeon]